MKVKVEVEVPDGFEPYTVGCAEDCPFGFWESILSRCSCSYTKEGCPMIKATKGEKTNE